MHLAISSRDNARFRQLRKLSESSRERRKLGQTLLDGAHLLQVWLAEFGPPRLLILPQDTPATPEAAALASACAGVDILRLAPVLLAELSPVATPSGVMALVDIPRLAPPAACDFGLLLEDLQDPGNLGSLLRSAAAAGVDRVWLSAGCVDAWSPKVLRGGMGAHFVLPITERADLASVAAAFAGRTLAACLDGAPLYDLNLTGPVAFMIGNEGAGLSAQLQEAASARVAIPMPGRVESLNAAAAAAVCLFERVRQTRG